MAEDNHTTDEQVLNDEIQDLVDQLNLLLHKASDKGITVKVDVAEIPIIGQGDLLSIGVNLWKPLGRKTPQR